MAKRRFPNNERAILIDTSAAVAEALQKLVATGRFGKDVPSLAEELVRRGLREIELEDRPTRASRPRAAPGASAPDPGRRRRRARG